MQLHRQQLSLRSKSRAVLITNIALAWRQSLRQTHSTTSHSSVSPLSRAVQKAHAAYEDGLKAAPFATCLFNVWFCYSLPSGNHCKRHSMAWSRLQNVFTSEASYLGSTIKQTALADEQTGEMPFALHVQNGISKPRSGCDTPSGATVLLKLEVRLGKSIWIPRWRPHQHPSDCLLLWKHILPSSGHLFIQTVSLHSNLKWDTGYYKSSQMIPAQLERVSTDAVSSPPRRGHVTGAVPTDHSLAGASTGPAGEDNLCVKIWGTVSQRLIQNQCWTFYSHLTGSI